MRALLSHPFFNTLADKPADLIGVMPDLGQLPGHIGDRRRPRLCRRVSGGAALQSGHHPLPGPGGGGIQIPPAPSPAVMCGITSVDSRLGITVAW